jgi:hypothetical protein
MAVPMAAIGLRPERLDAEALEARQPCDSLAGVMGYVP